MKKSILFLFALIFSISFLFGQTRYIDEVFSNVTTTSDILYGSNITVFTGAPTLDSLYLDLYEPTGDTASSRPVVIIVHDGDYLPLPYNNHCVSAKTDSHISEMSIRLAKCGYLVAAIDYRLGWNPTSGDQDIRTGTYLNAFYRVVQDIRNAVRFFKYSYDNGNPYSIANDKISVIGEGTGAFAAVAVGSLDSYDEIALTKFINPSTMQSFIDTSLSGSSYGTETRPLNLANYPSYSSDVNFIGNLGGMVGDSTWIEAGEPAIASLHCNIDPYSPYGFGAAIVPTTGDFLVNVSGSYDIQRISNSLGNNDSYINAGYNDPITLIANSRNDGRFGLYPLPRPSAEFAPWQWWLASCINNTNSMLTNPDMSETKGKAYIDTIIWFLTPRIASANDLVSTADVQELNREIKIKVYPNPSTEYTEISIEDGIIKNIALYDLAGRIVLLTNVNDHKTNIQTSEFEPGLYFVSVETEKGTSVKKLLIE